MFLDKAKSDAYSVITMLETIEAIYENGQFKPISPVDLPEGTRVRVELTDKSRSEQVCEQLVASGMDATKAKNILDNFNLLWDSYDSLTGEQQAILEEAKLDQQRFFDHF